MASAVEVGERFGYSAPTVHQLAAKLRAGRSEFFRSSKPGPKGPRKAGRVRDRVLALRAEDRSVTPRSPLPSMSGVINIFLSVAQGSTGASARLPPSAVE